MVIHLGISPLMILQKMQLARDDDMLRRMLGVSQTIAGWRE